MPKKKRAKVAKAKVKTKKKPRLSKAVKKTAKPARAGGKALTKVEAKVQKPQPVPFVPQTELVKKYQSHKGDTGSTGVQIALLTERIAELVKHLKKHAKDFDSRRGLLILVGKRRRLLNYLNKTNQKQYEMMVQDLGLRK